MSDKKKKIYIAIIIVCFLSTGAVLYYGFFTTPSVPQETNSASATPSNFQEVNYQVTNTGGSGEQSTVFSPGAPSVFPEDSKFDWTLIQSDQFKKLVPIPDLQLGPVGRDNPFSKP